MSGKDRPRLTLIHEDGRDMPPLWDGVAVTWAEWTDEPLSTMRFHSTEEDWSCHRCGSLERRLWSVGYVQHINERRGRTWRVTRFTAMRCRTCRTDTVHDSLHGTDWELDASDYGPNGSMS